MKVEDLMHKKTLKSLKILPYLDTDKKLYLQTIFLSVFLTLFILIYYLLSGHHFTERVINKVLADSSFLIIGLSLVLSSICYFFNFADKFIIYRKHLGLVGFGILIFHIYISVTSSYYAPFPGYYLTANKLYSFLSAISAFIIFAFMATISNKLSLTKLGPQTWRALLRLGFIGYVFSLYHFGIKNLELWEKYLFDNSSTLIPMSLIIFVFGCLVVILTILLFFKVRR